MYNIICNDENIGFAEIRTSGLYYLFNCTCYPKQDGIHRIWVYNGGSCTDLGICVPYADSFVLKKRIPIKRFSGKDFSFQLVSNHSKINKIEVHTGMAFYNLEYLDKASLEHNHGTTQIVIKESPTQQDNDPSLKHPSILELQ